MGAEEQIRARLEADGGLATIVAGRIFGGRASQGAPAPYIVWQRISGFDVHALDGRTGQRNGRIQVDCYATTYAQAVDMSRLAAAAIQDGNNALMHAELDAERDIYDEDTPKFFRRATDYLTIEMAVPAVAPLDPDPPAIFEPLEITGSPALTVVTGDAYSFTPTTYGGVGPYSFALFTTGPLPPGWTFTTATGRLQSTVTGAPATIGGITITATDSDGETAALGPFDIVIQAVAVPPPPPPAPSADIWYVAPETGSDALAGNTPATAFRNVPGPLNGATGAAAAVTLAPGSVVRFVGNEMMRKTIEVSASGTLANPIVYESHNPTGRRAVLDAADPATVVRAATSQADAGGAANWAQLHVVEFDPANSAAHCLRLFDAFGLMRIGRYPELAEPIFEDDIGGSDPSFNAGKFFTIPGVVNQVPVFTSAEAAAIAAGQEGYVRLCMQINGELIARGTVETVVGNVVTVGAYTSGLGSNAWYANTRAYLLNSRHHVTLPGSFAVIAPGKAIMRTRGSLDIRIGRPRPWINFRARSHVTIRNLEMTGSVQPPFNFHPEVGRTTTAAASCIIENNYIHDCYGERQSQGGYIPAMFARMTALKLRRNRIKDMMQISISRGGTYEAFENVINRLGGTAILYQNGTPGGLIRRNIISQVLGIHANGIAFYSQTNNCWLDGNFLWGHSRPYTYQMKPDVAFPDAGRFNRVTGNVMLGAVNDAALVNNGITNRVDDMEITGNVMISEHQAGARVYTHNLRTTLSNNIVNSLSQLIPTSGPNAAVDNRATWTLGPLQIVPRSYATTDGSMTADLCSMRMPDNAIYTLDLRTVAPEVV